MRVVVQAHPEECDRGTTRQAYRKRQNGGDQCLLLCAMRNRTNTCSCLLELMLIAQHLADQVVFPRENQNWLVCHWYRILITNNGRFIYMYIRKVHHPPLLAFILKRHLMNITNKAYTYWEFAKSTFVVGVSMLFLYLSSVYFQRG